MAPKFKFSEGERVLCFHGPLIYEAKCLKSTVTKEKQVKYFIHYAGWNKNWDEWVPESRVLKYNEENVKKQLEVQKAHSSQNAKAKKIKTVTRKSEASKDSDSRASTPNLNEQAPATKGAKSKQPVTAPSTSKDAAEPLKKKTRRNADISDSAQSEEEFLSKVEVRIKLPEELKPCLLDDWDCIERQRKVYNLPARINVDTILENYMKYKRGIKAFNEHKESAMVEVTNGIKEYFNVMLGTQLLYKFERPQYAEILESHPQVPMSQLYGSVHLLRLFIVIGSMLSYTPLDEHSIQILLANFQDFLKYLVKNMSQYFNLQDYCNTTPEYHRKAL